MYFWCFGFRGELGFLNCNDVCTCVVNKQFELLEFVSESVYVDVFFLAFGSSFLSLTLLVKYVDLASTNCSFCLLYMF